VEAWQDALEPQDSPVKQEDSLKLGGISRCSVKHISPTIQIPAKQFTLPLKDVIFPKPYRMCQNSHPSLYVLKTDSRV